MDPQQEAKYVGMGLMFESMVSAIGGFRALATQQAAQLQAQEAKIKDLEDTIAKLQALPSHVTAS